MATKTWRGDAQAIAQITTLTVAGTPGGAGDTIYAVISTKTITYTSQGTETLVELTAALLALLQLAQTTVPEFTRVVFTLDLVSTTKILATAATPSVPFTLTSGGTGALTCTAATPTASKGPYHWDDVNNWGGALPVNSDTVIVPADSPPCLFGGTALAAVTLADVYFLGGQGGLPDRATEGYLEYLGKVIELGDADNIFIGDGINGVNYLRLKVNGSGTCNVKIDNGQATTANVDFPSILLTSGGSVTFAITVATGDCGLAMGTGETALCSSLKVGTGGPEGSVGASDEAAAAAFNSGCSPTAVTLFAGVIKANASTALTIQGGVYIQQSGNIGAITNTGGTVVFNSNGTMGAITQTGEFAILDMSGDLRAVTSITSLSCLKKSRFFDPQKRLGNVAVSTDRESFPLCDFGNVFTVTRS